MENDQLSILQALVEQWPFECSENPHFQRDVAIRFHIGLIRVLLLNKYSLLNHNMVRDRLNSSDRYKTNINYAENIALINSLWQVIIEYGSNPDLQGITLNIDIKNSTKQDLFSKWFVLFQQLLKLDFSLSFFDRLGLLSQKLQISGLNKQKIKGAYYTPKIVTNYMARNALFLYFIDKLKELAKENKRLNKNLLSLKDVFYAHICANKALSVTHFIQILTSLFDFEEIELIKTEFLNILQNIRILDPTCGAGHFLTEIIDEWVNWVTTFCKNRSNIVEFFNNSKCNCFFLGWDLDPIAIDCCILRVQAVLLFHFASNVKQNLFWNNIREFIRVNDSIHNYELNEDLKIDIIIGNPPYLNLIENQPLRNYLSSKFPTIYHGKLDFCYYFLPVSYNVLKTGGVLSLVLKRYFLKSPTAKNLRQYLKTNFQLNMIVDFENEVIFDNAGIQTLILIGKKQTKNMNEKTPLIESTRILYANINKVIENHIHLEEGIDKVTEIPLSNWDDKWILQDSIQNSSFSHSLFDYTLDDYLNQSGLKPKRTDDEISIFKLVKGIQTGKDSVFIIDNHLAASLEQEKIKPFIKSSHINAYQIMESNLSLIISHQYSPIIGTLQEKLHPYPKLKNYLLSHKKELIDRSRSKDDLWSFWRKGDERNTVDFSIPKVLWPYRGSSFRAAIDFRGLYHSQDVVLLTLNWQKIKNYLPEAIASTLMEDWSANGVYFYAGLFNTPTFQKLLFSTAKEFARDVKDFQPNNFQDIAIPLWNIKNPTHAEIIELSKRLDRIYSEIHQKEEIIQEYSEKMDKLVFNLFYNIASSSVDATG